MDSKLLFIIVFLIIIVLLIKMKSCGSQHSKTSTVVLVSCIIGLVLAAFLLLKQSSLDLRSSQSTKSEGKVQTENVADVATQNDDSKAIESSKEEYTNYGSTTESRPSAQIKAAMYPEPGIVPDPSLMAANRNELASFAPASLVQSPIAESETGKALNTGLEAKKVVKGNFLDVTSKEVDAHNAVTNNALFPVMEQYMKIHENDPTRNVTMQSSHGLAFYDTRDPVNVTISEFPSTISAKLPIA